MNSIKIRLSGYKLLVNEGIVDSAINNILGSYGFVQSSLLSAYSLNHSIRPWIIFLVSKEEDINLGLEFMSRLKLIRLILIDKTFDLLTCLVIDS